ncbi:MAG: sulfite exporter TauE/SafE family protein [Alphaproteobacteria bacterium]|nr:sulfite exporter TauE/SafE family protein [Alphaproteobacteria bacterium]
MMDFLSPELFVALGVAAAAGLMRGFAGVGSGMLMAPVFAILFGPVQTVAIIVLMEIVVTGQLLPGVRREIDWKVIAPMGIAAACLMPVGSWLLVSLDPDLIARGIALVVVAFSVLLMAGWRYEGEKKLWATLGVGALSGVLMASTSLGNPPVMAYLLSSRDAAATNRANFTGYFAVTLVALIAMMAAAGLIDGRALLTAVALLPVFMAGAWIGSRLFRRSSEALYRRVALGLLLCVGLYGLLR